MCIDELRERERERERLTERDIFVKKNMVLFKKYGKQNYSKKKYVYGSGHPTKKSDLSKWMTDRLGINQLISICKYPVF